MAIIIKKPVAAVNVTATPLAPEVPKEMLYGVSEMQDDLNLILDAQAKIAGRKLPKEVEAAIKQINDANQQDQLIIKEAQARLLQHIVPANLPKEQGLTKIIGNRTVEISKCSKKRIIKDKQKAAGMMGMDVFWGVVSIPLKACDDYLTLPQREQVIETTFEDDRKLTVKAPIEAEL